MPGMDNHMPAQKIYLARHAAPDWTRSDLAYHLPPGPPLTPEGRLEAVALGAFLCQAGVSRIYSSPLERCIRTAEISAEIAAAPVIIHQALIEWQPGDTPQSVLQRIQPLFEQAAAESQEDHPVALVTHGGPIGALLLGLGMQEKILNNLRIFDHRNPLPTAGAWQIDRPDSQAAWQMNLAFKPTVTNPVV